MDAREMKIRKLCMQTAIQLSWAKQRSKNHLELYFQTSLTKNPHKNGTTNYHVKDADPAIAAMYFSHLSDSSELQKHFLGYFTKIVKEPSN